MMKILILSGHGLGCPNSSPDGTIFEYEWADTIAARLLQVLTARGLDAVLVNPEIQNISLKERVRRVNNYCANVSKCVLVSLHLNADGAGKWTKASGFSVFVSKNASRRSKILAELMLREAERLDLMGNRAPIIPDDKGCRFSTWSWTDNDIYILRRSKCPAVLTESAFMTNHEDCDLLQSAEGREMFVELHANALQEYVRRYG